MVAMVVVAVAVRLVADVVCRPVVAVARRRAVSSVKSMIQFLYRVRMRSLYRMFIHHYTAPFHPLADSPP